MPDSVKLSIAATNSLVAAAKLFNIKAAKPATKLSNDTAAELSNDTAANFSMQWGRALQSLK